MMASTLTPNWNFIGGTPVEYTLGIDKGSKPEKTPPGLIVTRAVETQTGWVGQVIIDKEIVYETTPRRSEENPEELAMVEVNSYVVDRVKALFRVGGEEDAPTPPATEAPAP